MIFLFQLSFLAQPWSFLTAPFLLIFLALLSSLPTVPSPGDTSFNILLLALGLHIFQLHLPHTPSPIFLFPLDRSLPLSTLFRDGISQVAYPAVIFFLPAFLLTSFLLSFSLADTFLEFINLDLGLGIHTMVTPTPMPTRTAFLVFFSAVLVLFSFLAMAFSSLPQTGSNSWDRYSKSGGLAARKAFVSAVITYATPYTFPPPFNLLQLVLIRVPSFGMRMLGIPYASYLAKGERILWRLTVGPLAVVIASAVWALSW